MKATSSSAARWFPLAAVIYAVTVSSVGAAWVASRYDFASDPSFLRLLMWQGFAYFFWGFAVVPFLAWIVRRSRSIPRALAALTALSPVVVLVMSSVITVWIARLHPDSRGERFAAAMVERLPIDLLIYPFVAASVLAFEAMRRLSREETARAEAERERKSAELQTLRAQLQPHFLFNALHTVNVLIESDPARAQEVLHSLSMLLRRTLESRDSHFTNLGAELETVRLYLAIQKARLGERLEVVEQVDEALARAQLPDFLLQPIVENAVVHGLAPIARGGTISIHARRKDEQLMIEIDDDGAGLSAGWEEGMGTSTTASRLRHLYGERASLTLRPRDGGGTTAVIVLPLEFSP